MTEEHKDWFEYGRLKAAWLIARRMDGSERALTQIAWCARRNAYRWLHRGDCTHCKFDDGFGILCDECIHNARSYEPLRDHWEPKEKEEIEEKRKEKS